MAETFPTDWRDAECALVAVPAPLVPYVGGLMKILEQRGFWADEVSFVSAYTAVIELQECMAMSCISDITDRQDALYRMLNTALFGVTYATESTEPLVVTPPIAPHVTLDIHDQDSLLGRVDRLTQLTDNSINGTDTPLYSYTPSVKALIQGVIDALGSDTSDLDSILSQLEIIAALVA